MESLLVKLVPFIKVLSAFCLMLVGIRFKLGIGLSILIGGLVMGLMFGMGLLAFAKVGAMALVQEKFLFLAAIVGLILILSDAMERSGQSRRLMDALSGYLTSPRLRLIFFLPSLAYCPCLAELFFLLPWSRPCPKTCASRTATVLLSITGFVTFGNSAGLCIPVLS